MTKSSRLPAVYEMVADEGMVLRSGRKIHFGSSTLSYDLRTLTGLVDDGLCPMLLHGRDFQDPLERDSNGMLRPFVDNKTLVKKYCKRRAVVRNSLDSSWTYYDYRIPKYMLNILKQDCCSQCLRFDLLLAIVSRYKHFIRFVKTPKFVLFRNTVVMKLDEVIRMSEENMRMNPLSNARFCVDCRSIKISASLINRGPDARIPAPGLEDMGDIDQSIWDRMPDRDIVRCINQAKELKKYITTPHLEVQKTYFKIASAGVPLDCVKNIFKFL